MRRGSAIPVVMIVMLIAATLGATLLFTTQGGYRATAQAAYRLRLQLFLVSALDEARSRLFQLTTPGATGVGVADAGLRDQILNRIPLPVLPLEPGVMDIFQQPPDLSQVDFRLPFDEYQGQSLLWATGLTAFADVPQGAQDAGAVEVLSADLRIHGLRYVPYDDSGSFPDGLDYYQSVDPFKDANLWHRDFTGYCTVTIHARIKTGQLELERKMSVTHDFKIVDMRPPARDFALFAYRSPVADEERVYTALNKGGRTGGRTDRYDANNPPTGRLILYPFGLGRVYIRGPYVMLSEGHTDGLGGTSPQPGPGYPQGRYENWGGFGQIPGPRGVMMPYKKQLTDWEEAPSPLRPQRPCTDKLDGSQQLGVPAFNQAIDFLKTTDSVGFGLSGIMLASSFGPNRQRFYLTGEPQCFGSGQEDCFNDGFRGIRVKGPPEEGEEIDPEESPMDVWSPLPAADGSYTLGEVKDNDKITIESGPFELGLYTVVKYYPFLAYEQCPRTSIDTSSFGGFVSTLWTRSGEELGNVTGHAGEILSFGAFTSAPYTRRWKDDQRDAGLAWQLNDGNMLQELKTLGEQNFSDFIPPQNQDAGEGYEDWLKRLEPGMGMMPLALHYVHPRNQGMLNSIINAVVDFGLLLTMAIPGPGLVANGVLRAGSRFGRGAIQRGSRAMMQKFMTSNLPTRLAVDMGLGLTVDRLALEELNARARPDSTLPDVNQSLPDGSRPLSSRTTQEFQAEMARERASMAAEDSATVLARIEGEVSEQDRQQAEALQEAVGSLEKIRTAYLEMDRRWAAAKPFFDTMMTGAVPQGADPRSMQEAFNSLREYESFGQGEVDFEQALYVGYLPPGLKPYQRLATRWYGGLQDVVAPDGTLSLDGVLALDQLPQEGEQSFDTDITYRGRGVLVSADQGDGSNTRPILGGNLLPADTERDHLILSYWNHLDPDEAKNKDGLGMITLGGNEYWATVVSPYGVRPLGRDVVLRGNMISQFVDRHRFPDSANLRLLYRWEILRPDLATDGASTESRQGAGQPGQSGSGEAQGIFAEAEVRSWQHVTVSPKVSGWYDSVQ